MKEKDKPMLKTSPSIWLLCRVSQRRKKKRINIQVTEYITFKMATQENNKII